LLILYPPSFYGINLNQNIVLQQIGFDGKTGTPWERMYKIGVGNLIITALGFVPGTSPLQTLAVRTHFGIGYYVTVLTIEKLGRKWIQIQGFLAAALFRTYPFLLVMIACWACLTIA
jgi:MFS transporter, PHS family, inorganic phosphate transporter